jgi:hypothetical protein
VFESDVVIILPIVGIATIGREPRQGI